MVQRHFPKSAITASKWAIAVLMLIGVVFLGEYLIYKGNYLFDSGIAFIAIGVAFMSVLFGFINWDDMLEIKEQLATLNKIEKELKTLKNIPEASYTVPKVTEKKPLSEEGIAFDEGERRKKIDRMTLEMNSRMLYLTLLSILFATVVFVNGSSFYDPLYKLILSVVIVIMIVGAIISFHREQGEIKKLFV